MSPWKRLLLSFSSPGAVFEDIERRPSWLVASICLGVLSAVSGVIVASRIDMEALLGKQFSGVDMPPEAMEQALQLAKIFQYVGPTLALVLVPAAMAVLALLFWLGLKLMSSDAKFLPLFSATLHAYWPPSVVGSLLSVVVVLRHSNITPEKLQSLVKSNIGAFLGPDAHPALLAALASLDVFTIWAVVLLILGLTTIGKITTGKATGMVVGLWVFYVALKIGAAFLQSLAAGM